MSSTTATSPTTSVPPSRIPVQPSPGPTPVSRSRTPGQSVNVPPINAGPRTPRQMSGGSSASSSGGRALPVPGGGSVGRAATAGTNRPSLQPLMESVSSDHRHSNAGRVRHITILKNFTGHCSFSEFVYVCMKYIQDVLILHELWVSFHNFHHVLCIITEHKKW